MPYTPSYMTVEDFDNHVPQIMRLIMEIFTDLPVSGVEFIKTSAPLGEGMNTVIVKIRQRWDTTLEYAVQKAIKRLQDALTGAYGAIEVWPVVQCRRCGAWLERWDFVLAEPAYCSECEKEPKFEDLVTCAKCSEKLERIDACGFEVTASVGGLHHTHKMWPGPHTLIRSATAHPMSLQEIFYCSMQCALEGLHDALKSAEQTCTNEWMEKWVEENACAGGAEKERK